MLTQRRDGTGKWLLEHPDFPRSGRKDIKRCFGVAEVVSCTYISGALELCLIETNELLAGVGKTVLA